MQEQEIFQDYEITGWRLTPKTYKILGIAAALHLVALLIVGQFDLLQTKACDSPYVGKVCQVLDFAYMSSVLLGTDTKFSSREYDKTDIEDADVTFINVTEPEFKYPEGYFAQSNPEPAVTDSAAMPSGMSSFPSGMNSFPYNPTTPNFSPGAGDLLNKPQNLPPPNKNEITSIPGIPFPTGGNPTVKSPRVNRIPTYKPPRNFPKSSNGITDFSANKDPKATAKMPDVNAAAKTEPPKIDAAEKDSGLFNKKPLEDFGTKYVDQILTKQVDINAPFKIEIVGMLDENGKITNAKMVSAPDGDAKMTEVAKEAIAAFSDSQLLKTLYNVGGRKVRIVFAQDKDNLQAVIKTETESDGKANVLSSLLNTVLKNINLKEGSDEALLMSKAQFATEGKNFVINFVISNDEKSQMIDKNLKDLKDKLEKKSQPNSVATVNDKNAKG